MIVDAGKPALLVDAGKPALLVDAAGVRLYVETTGEGPPLLLLHGFPLDHGIWRAQAAALSGRARLILPDLRGHGQSAAPPGSYRMDELAGDLIGLLDALGIEQAVVGGHSMGGYIAFAMWRRAPERVKGLALINTRAAADTRAGRAGRYQNAADATRDGVAAVVPRLAAKMYAPQTPAQMTAALAEQMVRTSLDGLVGALLGMAERPDSTSLLPQIGVPCAVIAGAEDQIVPAVESEAMAAALPAAELTMISGAGHMSMEERPEAVNAALLRLLARV